MRKLELVLSSLRSRLRLSDLVVGGERSASRSDERPGGLQRHAAEQRVPSGAEDAALRTPKAERPMSAAAGAQQSRAWPKARILRSFRDDFVVAECFFRVVWEPLHRERMLRKPEQPSTRIASRRIARVLAGAVLSGLLGPVAFAGQASALGPGTGTLGSVSGTVTQTVVPVTRVASNAVAPVSKAVTQTVAPVTQVAGNAVAPVSKAVTQTVAPVTQVAGNAVAPVSKAVTQTVVPVTQVAGNAVAPVSKAVTQTVVPVTRVASNAVAPVSKAVTQTGSSGLGTLAVGSSPSPSGPSGALPIVGGRAPRLPLSAAKPIGGGGESASTMPAAGASSSPVHTPLAGGGSGGPGGASPSGGSSGSHGPRSGSAGLLPGSGSLLPSSLASTTIASLGGLLATGASREAHNGTRPASGVSTATPGPSPGPGGGSAPSGGASGFGFSVFLTLAGLLVLGAPWATRRTRLASESWLVAPFLLMPERPG
jgi:hypothetical protein